MSFVDDLLTVLTSYSGGYKLLRQRMHGYYGESNVKREIRESTLRTTLSRLKKKGLVDNKESKWRLTGEGRCYIRKKKNLFSYKDSKKKKKVSEKVVVIFDIPEYKRKQRDWLRQALKKMNFKLVQKSVWLGPAPLPRSFINSLEDAKILDNVKFFPVRDSDIV